VSRPDHQQHEGPAVAAVVVTFNSSKVIEGWVDSFESAGLRDQVELCVVDSGSGPEEREHLRERIAPRVETLSFEPNLGFGRSCNVGAAKTSAPTLLFLNPDGRILSLPARALGAVLEDGVILGAVAHELGAPQRRRPGAFEHPPSAYWQANHLLLGRRSGAFRRTYEHPAWISGGALIVGRREFDALGGFSPEIFLYFEDADLCVRHRARGGTSIVDPEFIVAHPRVGTGSGYSGSLDSINRMSGRQFVERHEGRARALLLYGLYLAYYTPRRVLVAIVRRLTGASKPEPVGSLALDLLMPGRVLRRLRASGGG
jgi:N-acetylglucosaminyl-diphospho-decaprenol L-rhamnosyltransferase